MTDLHINGKTIPCEVTRRRVRNIYLRMRPGPVLEVVMPIRCNYSFEEIIDRKSKWIEQKYDEVAEAIDLITGEKLLYRGEPFRIQTVPGRPNGVRLSGNTATLSCATPGQQQRSVRRFLTAETLAYLQSRTPDLCEELGLKYRSIATRQMKKWGYCTRDGRLVFNWRLICLPQRLMDYVILHEVMHLRHFDHSRRFKDALAAHMPDSDQLDSSLRFYPPA